MTGSDHPVLARLRHPGALSWRVGLLYLPAGVVAVLLDRSRYGGDWVAWAIVATAGQLALSGVLALAFRRTGATPRFAFVLGAFALAGAVRGVVVGLLAAALGLAPVVDWSFRLAGGAIYSTPLLVIAALAIVAHDQHRAVVMALTAKRTALERVRTAFAIELARADDALASEVRGALEPHLREIDLLLEATGRGVGTAAAATLIGFIDSEVRPLARRLAQSSVASPAAVLPDVTLERARVPLPGRLALGGAISPLLLVVVFGLAILPISFRLMPAGQGAAFGAIVAVSVAAYFGAISRLLRSASLPTPIAVIALVAIHACYSLLLSLLLPILSLPRPIGVLWPSVVVCALVGLASAAASVVTSLRAATEEDLRSTVDILDTSAAALRLRAALARRRVAYIVHGELQAALQAAALTLSGTPAPDEATIAALRMAIARAMAKLDGPMEPPRGVAITTTDLAEVWAGACTIRLDPQSEDVGVALGADATEAAAAIVVEAVSNAIRHGRATKIDVSTAVRDHRLEVTVVNDGLGWDGTGRGGLGSALYNDLCESWRVEAGAGQVRLIALIPLRIPVAFS